jgi:hypothetical protein
MRLFAVGGIRLQQRLLQGRSKRKLSSKNFELNKTGEKGHEPG